MEVTDFIVEDLLDLPNGDDIMNDTFIDNSCGGPTGHSTDSSTVTTAVDSSCNSSSVSGTDANLSPTDYLCRSFAEAKFSSELCVPYDDMAELEWLSKFVEESFSTDDLHNHNHNHRAPPFHHTTATHPQQHHQQQSLLSAPPQQFRPNTTHHHHYPPPPHLLHPDVTTVPGKARSKISRVAPSDWSTRLLMVTSQPPQSAATSNSSSDTTTTTDPDAAVPHHKRHGKKRETSVSPGHCNGNNGSGGVEPGRRCLHCAAEKTPQWRTGPMGPKTLCNACGVRYKSGRLVPEYRPAASPTFVPTKHSNSHRKVLELRRQRDHVHRSYAGHGHHMMQQHQHQQQQHQQHYMGQNGGGVYGNVGGDQYLIHHHMGPGGDHYRQMI